MASPDDAESATNEDHRHIRFMEHVYSLWVSKLEQHGIMVASNVHIQPLTLMYTHNVYAYI